MTKGSIKKANVYFKQLDTMNPDFEGYEYVYAQSLHEENKTEEALRLVQKGLSKNEIWYQFVAYCITIFIMSCMILSKLKTIFWKQKMLRLMMKMS